MSDQPGWEPPETTPGESRPPLSAGWAAEQPPPARAPYAGAGGPSGWRAPYAGADQPPYAGAGEPSGDAGWGAPPGTGPPPPSAPSAAKPGVIPLRPLGVGEILDGAISTIRAEPRLMLGLSAVVAVVTQLVTVPVTWLLLHDLADSTFRFDATSTSSGNDLALTASATSAVVVQALVTLVATLLLTGVLTVALSRAVLGQPIVTGQVWAQARPRILPLFAVTALVLLIVAALAAVTLAPGVALLALGAPAVLGGLLLAVGVLVLVALAVYLYVAFALAPAVVVLERQGVRASLRRSRQLVAGAWWRTFGILLLVNVLARIIAGILSIPFTVLAFMAAFLLGDGGVNPYGIVPLLVTAVGAIIASAVTWPFTAVSSAMVYVDRRIRREALDIELTRAAGLTPPGAG